MPAREGRAFRITLAACALAAAVGAALCVYARTLSVYSVPFEHASAAFFHWCTDAGQVDHAAGGRYLALFGWRYALTNAGVSIFAGAVTTAALAIGLWKFRDSSQPLPWLRTPGATWTFIAIGIGATALLFAGVADGLDIDLRRQLYPACADSIAIPLTGMIVSAIVITPILAIAGGIVARGFGELPVSLFRWDGTRPRRSWTVSLVFLALMAGTVASFVSGIATSDLVSPALFILYLLAATRAALLADRQAATSAGKSRQ